MVLDDAPGIARRMESLSCISVCFVKRLYNLLPLIGLQSLHRVFPENHARGPWRRPLKRASSQQAKNDSAKRSSRACERRQVPSDTSGLVELAPQLFLHHQWTRNGSDPSVNVELLCFLSSTECLFHCSNPLVEGCGFLSWRVSGHSFQL